MNTAITPKFLKKLYNTPELVIDKLNLTYVSHKNLVIFRKAKDDKFFYVKKDKPINSKPIIERIESLVIPPAWENVKISDLENGHLQAVGRDVKNRKQYRYHPLWNKIRNQTKFYRMYQFGNQLPKIRAQVDMDLEQKGWTKTKVLALIIRLLEETHIRIGSEQYAKRNKTYGLSTLRNRHVNIYKDRIKFEFVGKKGKEHSVTLRNKKLMRLVQKCEEIPGWELFQYYDEYGEKQSVDSGLVNQYLKDITGMGFTAKDFRTWAATMIFFDKLSEFKEPENDKEIKSNILKAYDAAASGLGNTRNVCRKYYVHPMLPEMYEKGELKKEFQKADADETPYINFSNTEKVILNLLKNYVPEFSAVK